MVNIGRAVGQFLGFDPTPGFNITKKPGIEWNGVFTRDYSRNPGGGNRNGNGNGNNNVNNNNGNGVYYASGGGGGGYSAPAIDYNALAQYDQAIGTTNHALGRLGGQLNTAYGNIQDQYGTSLNEINVAKNKAQGSYNTGTTEALLNFEGRERTDSKLIRSSYHKHST